ncbi:hypothetical protein PEC302107_33980 [Pectobacterium araliae]|uniref:DUF6896 domain-containing protein n=1 Tax=Pectobacterium araliae TaxID=3073862 RepID=A0AAN0ML35_9GAMM|nr:hypothetical protein PEC302110_21490 [Pectobacterium sp. MAFF 302110]GKW21669.1 hypothetical protein PEC302107_33980 [Pectobacterium carotovorum subsp. carotovorum]
MMNEREIINFISLQEMLMKAFFIAYPSLKDFDFLLDFPKKGTIFVNDNEWGFIKHGKGIKFLISNDKTDAVVDINNIKNPKLIDIWRLSQYFPSHHDHEIKGLLDGMVESGVLQKISEKQYELI